MLGGGVGCWREKQREMIGWAPSVRESAGGGGGVVGGDGSRLLIWTVPMVTEDWDLRSEYLSQIREINTLTQSVEALLLLSQFSSF